jgi:uncharacterized protein (DUF58 family)
MRAGTLDDPLADIGEADLARLARIADPLLAGRALLQPGHRPARARAGSGIEFLDFREYAAGDDLRDVDWRATARARAPQVRRYRDETSSDWFVCLDASPSMRAVAPAKWGLAVQLAACMSYVLLHLGNRVSVLLYAERVTRFCPLGRGRFQYARITRFLREATPAGGCAAIRACLGRAGARNPIIVVSDFLAEDAQRGELAGLLVSGRVVHALQVLDRAEVAITETGPALLRDAENGASLKVADTARAASAAAQQLAILQADLAAFCRAHAVPFTTCWAAEGWKPAMLRHLLAASFRKPNARPTAAVHD